MENIAHSIAMISIIAASSTISIGSIVAGVMEGLVAKQAMQSIAQQPDGAGEISKTLFISMSLVESSAIYCLLVAMILIFSNPFWNFIITKM